MSIRLIKAVLMVFIMTGSANVFAQDLTEGKILASMKNSCSDELNVQRKITSEINQKLNMSDSDLMKLESVDGLIKAVGQLEFISSEMISEMDQNRNQLNQNKQDRWNQNI